MQLTKQTHSSVRIEKDGQTLILDPGAFGAPEEIRGADALLITHEHPDHFSEERVRAALDADPGLEVWTQATVAGALSAAYPGRIHAVGAGDRLTVAGFDVKVFGEHHARIHPDVPQGANVGFLVDDALFHPGDALTVPGVPVETLLFPITAPWSKAAEVVDYIRELAPARTIDVHNAVLSPVGESIYGKIIGTLTSTDHQHLAVDDTTGA